MSNRKIADGFKHIMEREAVENFLNRVFVKVGACSGVVSTNIAFVTPTYSTQMGIPYTIGGYFYSIAAIASGKYLPQGAGYSGCASGQARMWVVCLDSVGSVHLYGGSAVSAGVATTVGSVPLTVCPVALVKVSMASAVSFMIGTHAWGSGASLVSCTVEYWDISTIPQGVILSE